MILYMNVTVISILKLYRYTKQARTAIRKTRHNRLLFGDVTNDFFLNLSK